MAEPEMSHVALVLIDVINGFDVEGGEELVAAARRAAPHILALRERAHEANVPVVYVNETFGQPGASFEAIVNACSETERPGHNVARMLAPTDNDQLLLKPSSSAFSCAALLPLLERRGVRTLVLVGFAADGCLLASAKDASARGFEVLVPVDCTAGSSLQLTERALEQVRAGANASTPSSLEIDLAALRYAAA